VLSCLFDPAAPAKLTPDIIQQDPSGVTVVSPPGILANDEIPCGTEANVTVVTPPRYGSVVLIAGGGFNYTSSIPPKEDSWEYQVDCNGIKSRGVVKMPAPPGEVLMRL
jgi:hypothetical protein